MKIILLGYMGVGKSTLGAALASSLGWAFFDLDASIEADERLTVAQIFEQMGELYFRKKERNRLLKLLNDNTDSVIALGGGTVCYYDTMQVLVENSSTLCVYLKASYSYLTEQLWNHKDQRPLIAHLKNKIDLEDFVRKHLFERQAFYLQSELVINIEGKTINELVKELKDQITKR